MTRKHILIAAALVLVAAICWLRGRSSESSGTSGDETAQGRLARNSGDGDGDSDSPRGRGLLLPSRFGKQFSVDSTSVFGTVRGRVIDDETGHPVPYVDVIFRRGYEEASATSEGDGRYAIALGPGTYEIRAVGDDVIGRTTPPLKIGHMQEQTRDIVVSRLATLRGRVLYPGNRPADGVDITLRTETADSNAHSHRGEVGSAQSRPDGSFEMRVPPGVADLYATDRESEVYSTVTDIEPGSLIKGVELILDNRGAIAGTVRMPDGGMASGATVHVSVERPKSRRQYDRATVETDSSGRYRKEGLRSGRYVVEATLSGFGPSEPIKLWLDAAQKSEQVDVTLTRPLRFAGRVVDGEGNPVADAEVAQVWLGSKQRYAKVQTGPDGTFEFTEVGPGPHMLRARKDGYATAQLEPVAAPNTNVELRLVAAGGLQGAVTDGAGSPIQSFVVEVRADGSKHGTRTEFMAADGHYDIHPVTPGRYQVTVRAPGFADGVLEEVEVSSAQYADASVTLETTPAPR